jgi:hypothetical protein
MASRFAENEGFRPLDEFVCDAIVDPSALSALPRKETRTVNSRCHRYQTQWAAQFYVAAELTRRGYLTAMTFGNAPRSDLLVRSPHGQSFTVDVKGQSTRNFWLVQRREADANHYFVLVYLPPHCQPPQFFVLSSGQLMEYRSEYEAASKARGKYRDDLGGMNWATALPHRDQWDVFPR